MHPKYDIKFNKVNYFPIVVDGKADERACGVSLHFLASAHRERIGVFLALARRSLAHGEREGLCPSQKTPLHSGRALRAISSKKLYNKTLIIDFPATQARNPKAIIAA